MVNEIVFINDNSITITFSTNTTHLFVVTTVLGLLLASLVIVVLWQHYYITSPNNGPFPWSTTNLKNDSSSSKASNNNTKFWQEKTTQSSSIPFILALSNQQQPIWKNLQRALQEYNRFMSNILLELSKSLETAQRSEYELFGSTTTSNHNSKQQSQNKIFLLSSRIQHRIDKLSLILEQDEQTLHQLLQPFPELYGLANQPHNYDNHNDMMDTNTNTNGDDSTHQCHDCSSSSGGGDNENNKKEDLSHLPPPRYSGSSKSSSFSGGGGGGQKDDAAAPYDSSQQVIAHIVRDWTQLGQKLREKTYHWCTTQLELWIPLAMLTSSTPTDGITIQNTHKKVLVPGAGLGRLAYDLYQKGYHVEANEYSIVMASAAKQILSSAPTLKKSKLSSSSSPSIIGKLHPFACDFFVNEVNSEKRYESVTFPDWTHDSHDSSCNHNDDSGGTTATGNHEGSLSYTIGDFVELYSAPYSQNQYNAIVTCFFIDTASNIYEYISVIHHLLTDNDGGGGGIWINIGPVQWHSNAKLHPSVDELKLMIESMGFTIKHWSVDQDPIPYRHDDSDGGGEHHNKEHQNVESTKYEGYRPLRFVAIRNKSTIGSATNSMFRRHRSTNSNQQESSWSTSSKYNSEGVGAGSMESNHEFQSEYQQTVLIEELDSDDDDEHAIHSVDEAR